MFVFKTFLTGLILALPIVAYASGGGGYGGGYSSSPRPAKPKDAAYELGKAIYTGRAKGVEKISYCIGDGADKVKLKRKSVRQFKSGTYTELANNLYDCNKPGKLALNTLKGDESKYVLYYLNKRFKLNLN